MWKIVKFFFDPDIDETFFEGFLRVLLYFMIGIGIFILVAMGIGKLFK